MLPSSTSAHPPTPALAFRTVWLARYGSLAAAATLADHYLDMAAGDEGLRLRMLLIQRRLQAQSPQDVEHYSELASRMLALGDRAGHLIARSFALGAESFGGDVAAALAAFEELAPEVQRLENPLEQHVVIGASLFLYQASGNLVAYVQQACRMLQLANEVDHSGMRSASISNLGIAFYLAGDEMQARQYLEQSLASSTDPGGWVRFSAVAILADIYATAGDTDKLMPLLQVWSFPEHLKELDGPTLAHFHALGAEVFARQGRVPETRAYLDFLASLPVQQHSQGLRCMLALAQAMHDQAAGDRTQAKAELAEAMALAQSMPGGDRALAPRFWWMAAELSSSLGLWEQAYRHMERHRQQELERKHDIATVRRVAAQFQVDANARALEAAQRDRLTGLGNRERLIAVGDSWIARGISPALGLLNLRRFNAINEALGREVGDAVLQAMAERLQEACLRFDNAIAGRVYADQFAILVANEQAAVPLLQRIAAEMVATPLTVVGQWVDINAAWGVACSPAHGRSMHELMSHAEIALREDKRRDAGWTVYEAGLVRTDPRQLSLISELKRAAQEDQFVLLLQPKFRLSDDRVSSFEALIRWIHPTRGQVPPDSFIPFAESTGSIRGITHWVLRRAMLMSCRLRGAGLVSQVAVNVSVHDLGSDGLRDTLLGHLQATGARAEDIRLELTEGAVMRDPAAVIGRMREIHALGFQWSIDDFGTGQSSLAYLHTLPVSELKIDRTFVRGAASSSTTLTLLKAAVDLGRNLGLTTVGEGAESAEEWALLRELGCSLAQGWFGARPLPEQELIPWLLARSAGSAATNT